MSSQTSGVVTLTHELVQACRTQRGAFTFATVRALTSRETTALERGWPSRLVGHKITAEAYQDALAGRFKFVPRKKRKRRQERADEDIGPAPDSGMPIPGGW